MKGKNMKKILMMIVVAGVSVTGLGSVASVPAKVVVEAGEAIVDEIRSTSL